MSINQRTGTFYSAVFCRDSVEGLLVLPIAQWGVMFDEGLCFGYYFIKFTFPHNSRYGNSERDTIVVWIIFYFYKKTNKSYDPRV